MMKNAEMNSCSRESLLVKKDKQVKESKWEFVINVLILIGMVCGTVLCSAYITYSFYNMTSVGLANSLVIFGMAILIDLVVFRFITVSLLTLITTSLKLK